jgi:PilZ domain
MFGNTFLHGVSFSMSVEYNTIPRRQPRFEVKMPITVSGIDKDGCYFSASAETVNGSTGGMGLLMDRELYPFTTLVLSIPRDQQVLQIQTEVRHVTPYNGSKRLVGVKFRKAAIV